MAYRWRRVWWGLVLLFLIMPILVIFVTNLAWEIGRSMAPALRSWSDSRARDVFGVGNLLLTALLVFTTVALARHQRRQETPDIEVRNVKLRQNLGSKSLAVEFDVVNAGGRDAYIDEEETYLWIGPAFGNFTRVAAHLRAAEVERTDGGVAASLRLRMPSGARSKFVATALADAKLAGGYYVGIVVYPIVGRPSARSFRMPKAD
jgi:hypothetical protein